MYTAHRIFDHVVSNNVHILLKVYDHYTVVFGDSGSGKTFIYRCVKSIAGPDNIYHCFDLDNPCTLDAIKSLKGQVIFIDHADYAVDRAAREHIRGHADNFYVLFGRDLSYLYTGPLNLAEVQSSEDHKLVEFEFPFIDCSLGLGLR